MPGIDFRALRSMVSISQILDLVNFVPCKTSRGQMRGPCPIHRSANPTSSSFSVSLAKNTFPCFSCHRAGNQLDLWAAVLEKPLFEAAVELCQRLQIETPWLGPRTEKRNP